ncbi:MAG: hypothetical protein Kow0069_32040 [Promethearchaeota archaeon]
MKLERQRHVAFELLGNGTPLNWTSKTITQALWRALLKLFGEVVASKMGLWVDDFDPKTGRGVIRCSQTAKYKLVCAMALTRKLGADEGSDHVLFVPLLTSGTLKRLKANLNLRRQETTGGSNAT